MRLLSLISLLSVCIPPPLISPLALTPVLISVCMTSAEGNLQDQLYISHQRMRLLHLRFLLCGGMNHYFPHSPPSPLFPDSLSRFPVLDIALLSLIPWFFCFLSTSWLQRGIYEINFIWRFPPAHDAAAPTLPPLRGHEPLLPGGAPELHFCSGLRGHPKTASRSILGGWEGFIPPTMSWGAREYSFSLPLPPSIPSSFSLLPTSLPLSPPPASSYFRGVHPGTE